MTKLNHKLDAIPHVNIFRFAVVQTRSVYWANQRTAMISERGKSQVYYVVRFHND